MRDAVRARRAVAVHRGALRATPVTKPRPRATAGPAGRPSNRVGRDGAARPGGGHAAIPERTPFLSRGKHRRAQRAHGASADRDAVHAARLSRREVVMLTTPRPGMCWQVPDPEIPVVSVCELGIVREVRTADDAVAVVVTPTYSGCPATEVIATSIREALTRPERARACASGCRRPGPRTGSPRRAREAARLRHRAAGDAPRGAPAALRPRVSCPRCGSQTPNGCRSSAPPPARRCTAASTAANRSSTSSRSEGRHAHSRCPPRTQRNAAPCRPAPARTGRAGVRLATPRAAGLVPFAPPGGHDDSQIPHPAHRRSAPRDARSVSLRFEVPRELATEYAFVQGQHITLRTTLDGEELRRSYSICAGSTTPSCAWRSRRCRAGVLHLREREP